MKLEISKVSIAFTRYLCVGAFIHIGVGSRTCPNVRHLMVFVMQRSTEDGSLTEFGDWHLTSSAPPVIEVRTNLTSVMLYLLMGCISVNRKLTIAAYTTASMLCRSSHQYTVARGCGRWESEMLLRCQVSIYDSPCTVARILRTTCSAERK